MKRFVLGLSAGVLLGVIGVAAAVMLFVQSAVNAAVTAVPAILFQNDRVKITTLTLEPGQSTPIHTHERDEIVICLESSKLKISKPGPDTETEVVYPAAGSAFPSAVKDVTHVLTNAGDTRYKQIAIELK